MPTIKLKTKIQAPIERCFDLSRSIDLHITSSKHTDEKAIEGRTSGLIGFGEFVTWEAKHFGIKQRMTVKIIEFKSPTYFADRMIKGPFKMMCHEHHFEYADDYTLMTDIFKFESPGGFIGSIFNALFLTKYMEEFLIKRNKMVKEIAEAKK